MHIELLFFLIYLLACFWLIPKISFIKNSGLSDRETRVLLGFKMLTGVACAFYFDKIFTASDYVGYNTDGSIQYELLLSNPTLFFTDFRHDINTYGLGGIFNSSDSFWAYLRFNLLFKFIAILDLISGGNFYMNSVIFSSIVFFGHIAFFRIYNDLYKGHKLKILFCCFLIPSLLLYTSCPHKDGIVFGSLGIVSFAFYLFLKNKKQLSFKHVFFFVTGMLTIFLFRNFVLVALLPAMLTAYLCTLFLSHKRWVIFTSYAVYSLLFFISGHIHYALSFPEAVIKRKYDFSLLEEGHTTIPMNDLYPSIQSFLLNLPQAINHSLFRPYLWEFANVGVILTALELFFYQILVLLFIFLRSKKERILNNFNVYGFALLINMALIIGYTIPNVGAIVRYRSLFWILLVCPMVCHIQWDKIKFFRKQSSLTNIKETY